MRFRLKSLLVLISIVAVAMAFYLRPPKRLEDVWHIEIREKESELKYDFRFTPNVNRRSIRQVLSLLPNGGQIDFFDHNLTISDPGVYVTMCRVSEKEFYIWAGNHGWSDSWFAISADEAETLLWKCREGNLNTAEQNDWPWSDMRLKLSARKKPKLSTDTSGYYEDHVREFVK